MRTCEETAERALLRIEEEQAARTRRRQAAARIGVPVLTLCLAVGLGLFAWRSGLPQRAERLSETGRISAQTPADPVKPAAPPEAAQTPDTESGLPAEPPTESGVIHTAAVETHLPETGGSPSVVHSPAIPIPELPAPPAGSGPVIGYGPMLRPGDQEPVYRTIISAWPVGSEAGERPVPARGQVILSAQLTAALAEYGDDDQVYYRVLVCLYDGGAQVTDPAILGTAWELGAESERLRRLGYIVAQETFLDADGTQHPQVTLHASAEQVRDFVPDPQYGYFLCLYDEAG